ncbi:MAG TPA: NAD(P)H-binding protein, partial [Streptosporangiaceae bacterium]|nr:NAD(P)H-binding protein [Streptosporangiaceae bacterium]
IAILGGTGRIGGHVLNWALDAGYPVTALARSPEALLRAALVQEGRGQRAGGGEAPGPEAQRADTLHRQPPGAVPVGPSAQHGGQRFAAARGPDALIAAALSPFAGLTVVRGDALDESAVAEAIAGADAVVSALGPRGAKRPGLLAGAAFNTVGAMRQTGARRLICVSAAGAFITGDPNMSWLVKQVLPRVFARPFADVRGMEDVVRESGLDWTLVRATRLVNSPATGQYRVSPDYPPPGGGKISRADVAHFIAAALTGNSWQRSAPVLAY